MRSPNADSDQATLGAGTEVAIVAVLFFAYVAIGLATFPFVCLLSLPLPALAVLVFLHHRTLGRTGPTGAITFVLCGPVLWVVVLLAAAAQQSESGREQSMPSGTLLACLACASLVVPVIASLIHAVFCYEDWSPHFTPLNIGDGRGVAEPHVPFYLADFGLDCSSTVAHLEEAFRKRALALHPDRGGDEAEFRRMVGDYERARAYLESQLSR